MGAVLIAFCYARNVDGVVCDGFQNHPGKHHIMMRDLDDVPFRIYTWEEDGRELARCAAF